MTAPGTVYLVGAGPGDPELLTRKAWRLLGEADVVLHDALVDPGVRAAAPQARWIAVGKRLGRVSTDQRFIERLLVSHALRGETVVRLKGGDPGIFGRAAGEIEACRAHGIPLQIVPGVSAASAAAADLGISLTLRGVSRSVVFVTPRVGRGQVADASWIEAVRACDTAVLYMAAAQAPEIAAALVAAGHDPATPVCLVENASRIGARLHLTLAKLAVSRLPPFAGPTALLVGYALGRARPGAACEADGKRSRDADADADVDGAGLTRWLGLSSGPR